MAIRLLATVKSGIRSWTFSFDESIQQTAWLGTVANPSPEESLGRIELKNGTPVLFPAKGYRILQPVEVEMLELPANRESVIIIGNESGLEPLQIYVRAVSEGLRTFRKLGFASDVSLTIGRAPDCELLYDNHFVSSKHAVLTYSQGRLSIADLGSTNGTLVNGKQLSLRQEYWLSPGDVVEILDLTIGVGSGFITMNQPRGISLDRTHGMGMLTHQAILDAYPDVETAEGEPEVYYPAPRLSQSVHRLKLTVDNPPSKKPEEDQPVIMQIGPSFLMGLSSVFMVANSISSVANGGSLLSTMPSIAMAIAMVGGSVVWPIIARGYTRKRDEHEEARRSRLYVSYLDDVENRLTNEASAQAQILDENRRPIGELVGRATSLSPLLMNHTSLHDDFLDLRVGIGDDEVAADITWPQQHFSLSDDRMLDTVEALSKRPPRLHDIPLAFNPYKQFVAGVLGERTLVWEFLRGLLVQVCALYSYQDIKIILISDEAEREEWDFLTHLGHLYDATGSTRLVSLSFAGMVQVDLLIERELERRAEVRAENVGDYGTYYMVICANQKLAKRSEAVSRLLKLRNNLGFSLIYLGADLSDLPRECGYIIDLDPQGGDALGITLASSKQEASSARRVARMFARSDVQGTLLQFDPDIMVSRERANQFALALARIRLDVPEQRTAIPDSLSFLELFEVGSVNHLNIGQRWVNNDASQTLQTIIGAGAEGEPAVLNLHENIHGPHGLIAGTTGSGKSEFIITYILSMCVNYAPDEVAFVLIDYKGGGLAGAFENERHHLPHLAGTITNLDGGAIRRSLASIQSELKRRQDIFNKARDITGESTIDIYKYLSFYRQGVLTEPLPHLFIVADEFAELKQQEPEFMDELISAARIGRSLGVHLILATQKPSGVVNDQIWSNARFKVSLKVSDAADSKEMIRREDAAEITQPGRFYMLVGYNESFSAGQAAYAGGPYAPAEVFEAHRDNAVELLDAEGSSIARLRPLVARMESDLSELNAVLGQIEDVARAAGKQANRLWLDPLSLRISLSSLQGRYEIPSEGLSFLAGEIDDPESQRQFAFVVDVVSAGNIMLYGSQNSDVDGLLQAMLVSLASGHAADELWLYVVDYGTGTLARLRGLPQIGDVVLTGDTERLNNLFRMLTHEVADRRALLAPYGGSIESYNKSSETPLPRIVVALANLASFQELNEELAEELVGITRDAPRYGVHFIATASTANTPRLRLRANFGMDIPTMLNDSSDYVSLFGSMQGVTPPQHERRGMVKIDKRILEFQGLSIGETDEEEGVIVDRVAAAASVRSQAKARPIPMLPTQVTPMHMGGEASGARLPVGFDKMGIEPVWHDLKRSPYMLLLGNDEEALGMYLRGLHEALVRQSGTTYRFVDMQGLLGDVSDANVLRAEEDIAEFVSAIYDGTEDVQVLVFTSIVQTISGLPATVSDQLQRYITEERGSGRTSIVAATEMWRARSLYQDWYKVVTSAGNGIWLGGGFSDQTVFRFSRALPEYRQPAERSDGFYVMRGNVTRVRLLESEKEPLEEV